jgi:hypothetical protein
MTVIPSEGQRDDKIACLVALQNIERTEAVWITTQGPTWQLLEIARSVSSAPEVYCDPPRATRALVAAVEASGRTIEGLGTKGEGKQRYPTVIVDAVTGEIWTDKTRPGQTVDITDESGERISREPQHSLRVTADEREMIETARAIRQMIASIEEGDPDVDVEQAERRVIMRVTDHEHDVIKALRENAKALEQTERRYNAIESRALTSDCALIEDSLSAAPRRPIGFVDHDVDTYGVEAARAPDVSPLVEL